MMVRSVRRADAQVSRLALASALTALPLGAPALAQSFQGTPVVVSGIVNVNPLEGVSDILINSERSILNWTPTDTGAGTVPINFQPSGTTANFFSGSGLNGGTYTILNRIIPTGAAAGRAVAFNGIVNSEAGSGVWFYAPGGIVVGGTATFNVGSLLLTTGDPLVDGNGGFFTNGAFELTNTGSPTARIAFGPNTRVNALNPNSYVVMMAPQVTLDTARVDVNGSSALVAAESARFTMAGGLFDIAVTSGTGVANAISMSGGGIDGAASNGTPHRMYFVAVPKNDAITIAITQSGSLGFDVAGAANVEGNAIVLSAGYDIVEASSGGGARFSAERSAGGGTGAANIAMDWRAVNSFFDGQATGSAAATATDGGLTLAGGIRLHGDQSALLAADGGYGLTVTGDALISADAMAAGAGIGENRIAGLAQIVAQGPNASSILITGNATASARAEGGFGGSGPGGSATGGTARILARDGRLVTIGGNATIDMRAQGGSASLGAGGDAFGGGTSGTGDISGFLGGRVLIGGDAIGLASATGGAAGVGLAAGDGTGGRALIAALTGGEVQVPGAVMLDARGIAGNLGYVFGELFSMGSGDAGLGVGGTTQINAGLGTIAIGGTTSLVSSGLGGNGGAAGNGSGGLALVNTTAAGGLISLQADVSVRADGFGADPIFALQTDGIGSIGQRGTAQIDSNGGTVEVSEIAGVSLTAHGIGGDGALGGGSGVGGNVLFGGTSGRLLVLGSILLRGNGGGGGTETATGGVASGGSAILLLNDAGGAVTTSLGNVAMEAFGDGGRSNTAIAGEGRGGITRLQLAGVDASVTSLDMRAEGYGGSGDDGTAAGTGGLGRGGVAEGRVARAELAITGSARRVASGCGGGGTLYGDDAVGG
ncbi:hypothetical protein GCM10007973_31900 [Polymorphobacter multimanifer]|nr:hypothetical protein GCM10007973_31900 [Polymorphobacter multimanifer]